MRRTVGARPLELPPSDRPLQAHLPHQALDGAPRHWFSAAFQRLPHLAHAVDLEVLGPSRANAVAEDLVTSRARGSFRRIRRSLLVCVVGRRGDRQHLADRLDPVVPAVVVDELHHHFSWRSSSAWAKYADAFRRISLARFSSKFSRSSRLRRARSSVVRLPGGPAPRASASRTQLRSVSREHPIFSAIDSIASHCESYCVAWSRTIRTARSRSSGENLLVLAMTPSSQGMEPPGIPGRFSVKCVSNRPRGMLTMRVGRAVATCPRADSCST